MKNCKCADQILALARIALGWTFLWAFFDKLFGLGFATAKENAWLAGGSPTTGYLANAAYGPLAGIFNAMAGSVLVDWLFMLGLLGIGIGLTFGIARKLAGYSGAVMMVLMFLSALLPEHNPLVDDHIIYALMCIYFAQTKTMWSCTKCWDKLKIVKNNNWLA